MGNITKSDVKDGGGAIIATQSAAFDELGRVMQQIGAASQITAFGYDPNDNLTSVTDPDGVDSLKSETLAYDALGRLTDAVGGYGDIDYAYDAAHNRTSRTWAEGGSTVIEALTLASASNQVTQASNGTDTRTFVYDASGHATSDTRYDGTAFGYVYDQRGRMVELKRNSVTEADYLVDGCAPSSCGQAHQPAGHRFGALSL